MNKIVSLISILFLLISCEKEEIPVKYIANGDVSLKQVEMGDDYGTQLYYNFERNEVVASNSRFNHDFRLVKTEDYVGIRLNSAKFMRAYGEEVEFNTVLTLDETKFDVDRVAQFYDSTVIDLSSSKTYVVDFGKSATGSSFGTYKVKFEVQTEGVEVEYGSLDDAQGEILFVPFNAESGIQDFSMLNLSLVDNVPAKEEWDIKFTQYTDILEGHTPYLVTGVLINPFGEGVLAVNGASYDDYTLNTLESLALNFKRDEIGYAWKTYDFNSSSYVIDPTNAYLIKAADGKYRFFNFVGFYNEMGVKGAPSFKIRAY